ncbi:hypothetical protein MMC21_003353 [Puttea exsequens]|nr:hypothetical protein [Puttea exsequens]
MLLSPTLDCAPLLHPPRSSHTLSTAMLSPPHPTSHSSTSPVPSNIYSACRSLQSLIADTLPSSTSTTARPRPQPRLASPIALTTKKPSVHSKPRARPHTPPRAPCAKEETTKPRTQQPASRKRRRSTLDDAPRSPSQDQENTTTSEPSTPKRQRIHPPSLPLGLNRADFAALQDTASHIPLPCTPPPPPPEHFQNPDQTPSSQQNSAATAADWTPSDDSALVALILRKLQLRQSDWDECARRLGEEGRGSVGERWRVLVGEREAGGKGGGRMRRGAGGKRRMPLVQFGQFGGGLRPGGGA